MMLFSTVLEVLTKAINQEKEIRVIIFTEKIQQSTDKLLISREFSNVTEIK